MIKLLKNQRGGMSTVEVLTLMIVILVVVSISIAIVKSVVIGVDSKYKGDVVKFMGGG